MQEGPEPGHLHQERNNSKAPVAAQPGSSPDAGETAVGPRSAARAFARSVSRPVGVRPARQLRSPPQVRCLLPAAQLSNAPARRIQRLRGAGGVADGGVADGGGAGGGGAWPAGVRALCFRGDAWRAGARARASARMDAQRGQDACPPAPVATLVRPHTHPFMLSPTHQGAGGIARFCLPKGMSVTLI